MNDLIKIKNYTVSKLDNINYTISEISTIKNEKSKNCGKETRKVIGYYSSLEQALISLFNRFMISDNLGDVVDECVTIKQLITVIENSKNEIILAIKGE